MRTEAQDLLDRSLKLLTRRAAPALCRLAPQLSSLGPHNCTSGVSPDACMAAGGARGTRDVPAEARCSPTRRRWHQVKHLMCGRVRGHMIDTWAERSAGTRREDDHTDLHGRTVVAGANAMILRRGLELASKLLRGTSGTDKLDHLTTKLRGIRRACLRHL